MACNRKLLNEDIPQRIFSNKDILDLSEQLIVGDSLLIYEKYKEELLEMDRSQIAQQHYLIRGFENDGTRIILTKVINAQPDKEIGKGESIKDYKKLPEKIRCSIKTIKYLIVNKNCKIKKDGTIELIKV